MSINACSPKDPPTAAAAVTLKSPLSVTLEDQAERFPDSNPLLKIRSARGVGVKVAVAVLVGVGVLVAVAVLVGVGVAEGVIVAVGVFVFVGVGVLVGVGPSVAVEVAV